MTRGAGGTKGGGGKFLIGFVVICSGLYLLLQSISVTVHFGLGMHLLSLPMFGHRFGITSGMILIPFIFGIGMIFYNAKNLIGWGLTIGSMAAMIFGVIASTQISLRNMTAFELITILTLTFGGIGLFLNSLRDSDKNGST
jgi:hypothetical protein